MLAMLPAGQAKAAQRWTSPASTDASGSCIELAPCRIDHAITGAAAGDEVIVTPGNYPLSGPLSASVAIDLHGVAGQPHPRLKGTRGTTLSFKAGGTVRHLAIEASGALNDALSLQRGVAEGLLLTSTGGDGAKVVGDAAVTTVLRDSVVRTTAPGTGTAAIKTRDGTGSGGGDIALRNVTAIATGGQSTAIRCETSTGQTTLVNTIARGVVADIDASSAFARCTASNSNFRPGLSVNVVSGTGNQSSEPVFVDASTGDFHEASGSPTIDAGAGDALLGSADPDGRARSLGAAPDIGAYEYPVAPTPATPPTTAPGEPLPPQAPPRAGQTVNLRPERGTVAVRTPGSEKFVTLDAGVQVPVGSIVDTRRGAVRLESARNLTGGVQAGVFHGSLFQIRQRRSAAPVTNLVLRGGRFAACRKSARRAVAVASGSRRVRRLWGRDRSGSFRTRGRHGAATVRGTVWLTEDRCDGTRYAVRRGSVAVNDPRRQRPVIVRAGEDHLVRAR